MTKNAKINKNTIFSKNDFSIKKCLGPTFLLLILIDILNGNFKKITKYWNLCRGRHSKFFGGFIHLTWGHPWTKFEQFWWRGGVMPPDLSRNAPIGGNLYCIVQFISDNIYTLYRPKLFTFGSAMRRGIISPATPIPVRRWISPVASSPIQISPPRASWFVSRKPRQPLRWHPQTRHIG